MLIINPNNVSRETLKGTKNCGFIFTIPIYKNYDKDMVNTGILNNSVEKCAIEFSDIYSVD